MYPKLFIFKEFYFLILESNVKPHHKYSSNELLSTKTKKYKINELLKQKKKVLHNNFFFKNGQFTFDT